jgi:hypothetical protein
MHRLHRIQAMKAVRLRAVTKVGALIPVFFLLSFLAGCGGSKPPGPSLFPGKITLTPATIATVQLGSTVIFSASAQNASGTSVNATFTYQSSDTSILNIAPNGVACAGIWDAAFVNCTPGNYGVVQVTASAFGATSPPTLVYVHPPVDNVQVSFICPLPSGVPPACPGQQTIPIACVSQSVPSYSCTPGSQTAQPPSCLSANQSMTLQAKAFSKGVDVTASVGPFTWTETSSTVAGVTPIVTDTTTNIPTNQISVTPNAPGFTAVYAAASNVSSQPYFAETCPVQCVALELGGIGSGQTSFSVNKSTSQTVIATAVDVQGCVVPKATLTWSSSQPGSVLAGSDAAGCPAGTTCAVSTPAPGSGSVTAACVPPTCNIGFPQSVAGLPQTLVQPVPVYPVNAISGLVSGAPVSTSVLVTSLDCATNLYCSDNLYSVSTSTNESGNPTALPAPPNSLLLDPAGDKAYMGGNFESLAINPANFGSSNSPFSSLGNVTGKVLATSANGNSAIFSDTTHTPNQVYVVNTAASSASGITTLYISGATAAAFSPDGLKAFIVGPAGPSCNIASAPACLYVYSPVQALQTIPLTAVATAITFSSTGAFAFLTGGSATSAITAFNTCDNSSIPLAITLPAAPLFLKDVPPGSAPPPVASAGFISACDPKAIHSPTNCAGLDVLIGLDNTGMDLIATNNYQPSNAPACPQTVAAASNPPFSPQHFDLGQGTFNPINFFLSPDASTAYIVASDRSEILVYNFLTHATAGIPLANNITTGQSVTPVTASITVDGTLIYVAGSDGNLHEVSTTAGTDLMQITFPNLPDVTNPFCSNGASTIACTLDFVAVKP